MVKNPPATQETWVQFLGWEDPLEEGMATHSSILAWRIPMDRGAWWARSPWGRKESDATEPLTFSFLFQNQEKQLIQKAEKPQTWNQMSLAWYLISYVALGMSLSLSEYFPPLWYG